MNDDNLGMNDDDLGMNDETLGMDDETLGMDEYFEQSSFMLMNEENEPLLSVPNFTAHDIIENYAEVLTMMDNVADGNVQCLHCREWFSKEKINKGAMPGPQFYHDDGSVITDEIDWITHHFNSETKNCKNNWGPCRHVNTKKSRAVMSWSQENIISSKDAQEIAKQFIKKLNEFNTFLKLNSHYTEVKKNDKNEDFVIISDYA